MHDVRNQVQSLTYSIKNFNYSKESDKEHLNRLGKQSDEEGNKSDPKKSNVGMQNQSYTNLKSKSNFNIKEMVIQQSKSNTSSFQNNVNEFNNKNSNDKNLKSNAEKISSDESQNKSGNNIKTIERDDKNKNEEDFLNEQNENIKIKESYGLSKNLDKTQDLNKNINNQSKKIEKNMRKLIERSSNDTKNDNLLLTPAIKQQLGKKYQPITKKQTLDLSISFDNDSIINDSVDVEVQEDQIQVKEKEQNRNSNNINEKKNNNESKFIDKSNNSQTTKSNEQNSDIIKLINYSKNPEDLLNVVKFIKYKISFLYHIDLLFENRYVIKSIKVEPNDILSYVSKMMQILFINKNNQVILKLKSKIDKINIDIHMFKYLICFIVLKLHERKNKNIELNIELDNYKIVLEKPNKKDKKQQLIKIETNVSQENLENQSIKNKNFNFQKYSIFKNIIKSIGQNSFYNQTFDPITCSHKIDIQQPKTASHEDKDPDFYKKVIIKDDKVIDVLDKNLLVQSDLNISKHENMIFINIDDEVNIKSMHTLIFSRSNIDLNCCSNVQELKQMMMVVQSKQQLKREKGEVQPCIVVLLDHVLDGVTGLEVQSGAMEIQSKFTLDVFWVLLSSSEDEVTLNKYKDLGVSQFIQKPLTKGKLNNLIDQLKQNILL